MLMMGCYIRRVWSSRSSLILKQSEVMQLDVGDKIRAPALPPSVGSGTPRSRRVGLRRPSTNHSLSGWVEPGLGKAWFRELALPQNRNSNRPLLQQPSQCIHPTTVYYMDLRYSLSRYPITRQLQSGFQPTRSISFNVLTNLSSPISSAFGATV